MVGKKSSKPMLESYVSDSITTDRDRLAKLQAEKTSESRIFEIQRTIQAYARDFQETGRPGPFTEYMGSMEKFARDIGGVQYDNVFVSPSHPAFEYVMALNYTLGRTDLLAAKTVAEEYGTGVLKGGRIDFDSILSKDAERAETAVEVEQAGKIKAQHPYASLSKLKSAAHKNVYKMAEKIKGDIGGIKNSPFMKYSMMKQFLASGLIEEAAVSGYRAELEREVTSYQQKAMEAQARQAKEQEQLQKAAYQNQARAQAQQQRAYQEQSQRPQYQQQPRSQPQPQSQQQQQMDINQLLGALQGQQQQPQKKGNQA